MEENFVVYFLDCDGQVTFADQKDAVQYAKFNNGIVRDIKTWKVIADYADYDEVM